MNSQFVILDDIKNIIDDNNKLLKKDSSCLYMLYIGFCNHLNSYIEAYKLLFNNKNYYVCRSIERSLIDLYIKSRLLLAVNNPEIIAKSIIEKGKIKRKDMGLEGKGYITDTELCKHFDLIDKNFDIINEITREKGGVLTNRFRDASRYIHPALPCIWSYTTDTLGNYSGLIEDDKRQFIEYALLENKLLSQIYGVIYRNQLQQDCVQVNE